MNVFANPVTCVYRKYLKHECMHAYIRKFTYTYVCMSIIRKYMYLLFPYVRIYLDPKSDAISRET